MKATTVWLAAHMADMLAGRQSQTTAGMSSCFAGFILWQIAC